MTPRSPVSFWRIAALSILAVLLMAGTVGGSGISSTVARYLGLSNGTVLSIGAVSDGQALTRSGTTITGASVALSDAGLTSLEAADSAAGLAYPSAANTWTRLAVGTDGQVLTLAAGAPSWAATSSSGSLVGIRYLTSGTAATYTPTAGTVQANVCAYGAGGGGGGITATTSQAGAGGGGGAGGMACHLYTSISSGTYTIGAAGTAGSTSGGDGGAGGATTFTDGSTALSATGGGGGKGMLTGTSVLTAGGGQGTIATGGDINTIGAPGRVGWRQNGSANASYSGDGGSCPYGGGGVGLVATGTGTTASGYCAGGSGALGQSGSGAAAGGAGAPGLVVVWEYR